MAALTDGLVSVWRLDEASGQRQDAYGSNHLTDNGSVGSAAGQVDNAADFSLSGQSLSHADDPSLEIDPVNGFTLSLWFRPTVIDSERSLVTKDALNQRSWVLTVTGTGLLRGFAFASGTSSEVRSANAATLNAWNHGFFWFDPADATARVSLNGGATTGLESPISGTLANTTSNFKIGNRDFSDLPFRGQIDEVAVWQRVLTADERKAVRNLAPAWSLADFTSAGTSRPVLSSPYLIGDLR